MFAMGRAKQIVLGSKTGIETTKYTKKSINKALKEIEKNEIDYDLLKSRIKRDLLTNDLFLKNNKSMNDDDGLGIHSGDFGFRSDEVGDDEFDDAEGEDDFIVDGEVMEDGSGEE
jgi:DNA-directed RNA polymerase subunit K/omega